MSTIHLHDIISYLSGNKDLFIEKELSSNNTNKQKNNVVNITAKNIEILHQYDKMSLDLLPMNLKKLIPPNMYRIGIKQESIEEVIEKNQKKTTDEIKSNNISFYNSVNHFSYDNLKQASHEEQIKKVNSLKQLMTKLISFNTHRKLRYKILKNEIDDEVIQSVINTFQRNLIIIDIEMNIVKFYNCYISTQNSICSKNITSNQYLVNFFCPLNFMIKINNCYEPIFNDVNYKNDDLYKFVINIFPNYKYNPELRMNGLFLSYFNKLQINLNIQIWFIKNLVHPYYLSLKTIKLEENKINKNKYKKIKSLKTSII